MEELEKLRKDTLSKVWKTAGITTVIVIPVAILLIGSFFGSGSQVGFLPGLFVGFIIALMVTLFLSSSAMKTYRKSFLEKFIKKEFEKHFEEVEVEAEGYPEQMIEDTHLIRNGNTYRSNDLIRGVYRGIPFSKGDVWIEQVTSSGKSTTRITYFKGQWICISGLKKSVEETFVVNKKLMSPSHKSLFSNNEYERVDTESIEFNDVFRIDTKSAHDVFYVLTPHVMERFLAYSDNSGFGVYLIEDSAQLAIDTRRDSLEPSLFRAVSEKDYKGVEEDIASIKETIDLLLEDRDKAENE